MRLATALALVLSVACATEVSPATDANVDAAQVDAPMLDTGGIVQDAGALDVSSIDTAEPVDSGGADTACAPATCESVGASCGEPANECGGLLSCGECETGTCVDGTCEVLPVDCSPIAARPDYEVCSSTDSECQGVFNNGSGCNAFCAAAGLVCTGVFGGEAGCVGPEATAFGCDDDTGHTSDWCVCGRGGVVPPDPECGSTGTTSRQGYRSATYAPRTSWVLNCRDYAYTAQFEEHEACDSEYREGSGRGTARFDFSVPRGLYEVVVSGRHSENRNPRSMLVHVDSGGMRYSERLNQRGGTEIESDTHGTYCLEGAVVVTIDSTDSGNSDSVSEVELIAR